MKEANLGVITAAAAGGNSEVNAVLLGMVPGEVKHTLEEYGVATVVAVTARGFSPASSPDFQSRVFVDVVRHFELSCVLGCSSVRSNDLLARAAAQMDAPLAVDCMAVDLANRIVEKSHFSGRTIAAIAINRRPFLCTIRPNVIEPKTAPTEARVHPYWSSIEDNARMTIKEIRSGGSKGVDIGEAQVVITGGRPIGSADNLKILYECAEAFGGAVGASRALVDAGHAPHALQVGQTGRTVSPKLYIGCGISGSVQHFAGMKGSKVIVRINMDKTAPIFSKCDYGLIGDLFEVVPALTRAIKDR
jgi:electron transfer flavoprotein alpha subunit